VEKPKKLRVLNAPKMVSKNRLHPSFERGVRTVSLKPGDQDFLISTDDFLRLKPGSVIRLMGAYNVLIDSMDESALAKYQSTELEAAKEKRARLLNWVKPGEKIKVEVIGANEIHRGFGEGALAKVDVGEIVQFERFGFVRIDRKNEGITAIFAHK
jgi:glutamyl-tRNA synthetase